MFLQTLVDSEYFRARSGLRDAAVRALYPCLPAAFPLVPALSVDGGSASTRSSLCVVSAVLASRSDRLSSGRCDMADIQSLRVWKGPQCTGVRPRTPRPLRIAFTRLSIPSHAAERVQRVTALSVSLRR